MSLDLIGVEATLMAGDTLRLLVGVGQPASDIQLHLTYSVAGHSHVTLFYAWRDWVPALVHKVTGAQLESVLFSRTDTH